MRRHVGEEVVVIGADNATLAEGVVSRVRHMPFTENRDPKNNGYYVRNNQIPLRAIYRTLDLSNASVAKPVVYADYVSPSRIKEDSIKCQS